MNFIYIKFYLANIRSSREGIHGCRGEASWSAPHMDNKIPHCILQTIVVFFSAFCDFFADL